MYKKGWLLICTDFDRILVSFWVYHTLKMPYLRIFAENISETGNYEYGKWGRNLHFQEYQIDYLWFSFELIFLVFWFFRFLCKFEIYRKQGTEQFCCKSDENWRGRNFYSFKKFPPPKYWRYSVLISPISLEIFRRIF